MTLSSSRWRYVLAFLVAAMGLINVLSAFFAKGPGRIELLLSLLPLEILHATRTVTVLAGAALLFLAYGLARRKHQAYRMVLVSLLVSTVAHLIKGLDYEESMGSVTLVLGLLLIRPQFTARSDPPSMKRGLLTVAAALLFAYLYGIWGFYFLDGQFNVNFSLPFASVETVRQFFTFGDTHVHPITHHGRWFLLSLDAVGVVSLTYSFFMILRPVVLRRTHQMEWEREKDRAKALVEVHGKSALARMALFPDKLFHFHESGEAFVAFAQVGNVAVTLGDPIGTEESIAEEIRGYRELCEDNDWFPAFYQVLPDHLDLYREAGLRALKIGEEAIIPLREFNTSGNHWRSLRAANNKLIKSGFATTIHDPPIGDELLGKLRQISDDWLEHMHGSEKRFSLGWFDPDYLRECRIVTVVDPEQRPVAFANLLSEYRRNCVAVDLMRYLPEAPKGVMDLLFVRTAEYGRDNGIEGFNLGLAPLSGVGGSAEATHAEQSIHYLYRHFNKFYSFEGLRTYKEKFLPEWEPRYLIYTHEMLLPKIALAIVRADSSAGLWSFLR